MENEGRPVASRTPTSNTQRPRGVSHLNLNLNLRKGRDTDRDNASTVIVGRGALSVYEYGRRVRSTIRREAIGRAARASRPRPRPRPRIVKPRKGRALPQFDSFPDFLISNFKIPALGPKALIRLSRAIRFHKPGSAITKRFCVFCAFCGHPKKKDSPDRIARDRVARDREDEYRTRGASVPCRIGRTQRNRSVLRHRNAEGSLRRRCHGTFRHASRLSVGISPPPGGFTPVWLKQMK
jgi:hypothetical protein